LRGGKDDWTPRSVGSRRTGRRAVAIAASREIGDPTNKLEHAFHHATSELGRLNAYDELLLRRPKSGSPGLFEMLMDKIAASLGVDTIWFTPEGTGREATFHRDYRMVEAADVVIAYFTPERVMEGGTAHVVEAALNREVPVYAWVVDDTGVTRLGELELSDIAHG
jgi:hypothetical protein